MPFYGRDWRSPGEVWVKTKEGWERKKIVELYQLALKGPWISSDSDTSVDESKNNDDGTAAMSMVLFDNDDDAQKKEETLQLFETTRSPQQPYCYITLKPTREVAGFNTMSEALRRLDFSHAIRDIRRFHYIGRLLHLLITENLTMLSGCASRVLFTLLEELAEHVMDSKGTNAHVLEKLVNDLHRVLHDYYCWGRPLGSTKMWEQHWVTLQRLNNIAQRVQHLHDNREHNESQKENSAQRLDQFPSELLRDILLRFSDHKDLENVSNASELMKNLLKEEQVIWRKLCMFHFTPDQVAEAARQEGLEDPVHGSDNWQRLFYRLKRKYGLREEYADFLFLCRHCRCLFWKSGGHPCRLGFVTSDDDEATETGSGRPTSVCPDFIPVSPQAFLQFFSL